MDDASEKSEQASPQKLREAQSKGSVLRSQELSVLTGFLSALVMLLALVPAAATAILYATRQWVASADQHATSLNEHSLLMLANPGMTLVIAIFAVSAIFLTVTAAAYGGIHFSGFPLKPDFSRIHPLKGLKRIFSRHTLAETAKAILKALLILGISFVLMRSGLSSIAMARLAGIPAAAALLYSLALHAILWLIAIQLAFSVWDLWYARQRYFQQLRMSRRELKDEYKRQEGDPEIRRKRKQLASGLLAQMKALANVRHSDVVVTNPTHIAVALKYEPTRMSAPSVACCGRGAVAAMVRTLARRHRIPIIRQPALARDLINEHRIGEQIRPQYQPAVVTVYRWLLAQPGNRLQLSS